MSIAVVVVTFNRPKKVLNLLRSLGEQTRRPETVVIVNNYKEPVHINADDYREKFRILILNQTENLYAGGGRNAGFLHVQEYKYVAFIDDDNTLALDTLRILHDKLEADPSIGMIGPLMLYDCLKGYIWCNGSRINLRTSLAEYTKLNTLNPTVQGEVFDVQHLPNFFMVRARDYAAVGGIEPTFCMHYEESDFAMKIHRLGKRVCLHTSAVTYHDTSPVNYKDAFRHIFGSEARAYFVGRNRLLFMKRNASVVDFYIFVMFIFPLICSLELLLAARESRGLKRYVKGVFDFFSVKERGP